jgi:hypothetical protein
MDEQPKYSEISELEMRDLEAEFGRPLTREMALWLIRQRINRAAVERMLRENEDEEEQPGGDTKEEPSPQPVLRQL